jgi:hypothetical protein
MAELHCWASRNDTWDLGFGSKEYIDAWVEREFDSNSATCLLPAGHAGAHEWTPDGDFVIEFADPVGAQVKEG